MNARYWPCFSVKQAGSTVLDRRFDQRLQEGATMNVRYRVTLDTSERVHLVSMVLGGTAAARMLKRAQISLAADKGSTDEESRGTSPSEPRPCIG